MNYLENEIYRQDVETAIEHTIDFKCFYKKSILILGASGLIGSFITDCFIYANKTLNAGITVYAASRSIQQLKERFGEDDKEWLSFIEADVSSDNIKLSVDYIIHAASYGHPRAFRETPVEVLLSNVIGIKNLLEMAKQSAGCRVIYISSGEVQEHVEHLSVRACYPMGKKAAETLCVSYHQEYGVDVVIARPCHTFGANITQNDNRATAQFLTSGAKGINIDMYSIGNQIRSFSYVADCASGLMSVLAEGESGLAYGISSGESCTIKSFADKCAEAGKCKVKMHIATEVEKSEASPIKKQIVSNDALMELGWHPAFSIDEGIARSVEIIKGMSGT